MRKKARPAMVTTVKQIVAEWLTENGYDGLCNNDGECACYVNSLAPCGEM